MADWTNITDSSLDPDAPLTSELAYAWRDNPIAMLEGATGAPYNQWAWHPYDGVTVGDGNDGKIFDFAIDGALTLITSPDFVDGYAYRFFFDSFRGNANDFTANLWRATTGAYAGAITIAASVASSHRGTGYLTLEHPRRATDKHTLYADMHFALVNVASALVTTGIVSASQVQDQVTPQKLLRAQFGMGAANGGRIYMERRRTETP